MAVFLRSYSDLHSILQCVRVLRSTSSPTDDFLIFAHLVSLKLYLILVLNCDSLITSESEHLLIFIHHPYFSPVKCLFMSLPVFLFGYLPFS